MSNKTPKLSKFDFVPALKHWPEEANYVAVDRDGRAHAFSAQPYISSNQHWSLPFNNTHESKWAMGAWDLQDFDWRETRISRDEMEERERRTSPKIDPQSVKYLEVTKGTATAVLHVSLHPSDAEKLLAEMMRLGMVQHFEAHHRDASGQLLSWIASAYDCGPEPAGSELEY